MGHCPGRPDRFFVEGSLWFCLCLYLLDNARLIFLCCVTNNRDCRASPTHLKECKVNPEGKSTRGFQVQDVKSVYAG